MANFMGPMAPPQAAPQTPPQMDVKSSPSQRASFKNFMRSMAQPAMPQLLPNIGMGVPPEQQSFAPMPQIPSPMMNVDIFSAPPMMMADGGDDIFAISQFPAMGLRGSVQGLAMGGPVGGGADAGQMAADAFSGNLDGQQGGPSGGGMGPSEKADALSDILNAAPVVDYSVPTRAIMDSLNIPAPVQGVVNMATQGVSMPGPMGIGSVSIAPDFGNLLGGDIGLGATYAVNFEDGGQVSGGRRTATLSGAPMDRRAFPALDDYGVVANFQRLLDRIFNIDRDVINESRRVPTPRSNPTLYRYGYEDGGIVSFFNGGEVDGRERAIAEASMGGFGPAADPDGIGAGQGGAEAAAQAAAERDYMDIVAEARENMLNKLAAEEAAAVEALGPQYREDVVAADVFGPPQTEKAVNPATQTGIAAIAPAYNEQNIMADLLGEDYTTPIQESYVYQEKFGDMDKPVSGISFNLFGKEFNIPTSVGAMKSMMEKSQLQRMKDIIDEGGEVTYSDTGEIEGVIGPGMFGIGRAYTGPLGTDPFAQPFDETSVGGAADVLQPIAPTEMADPCPPGYELKDGTCVPKAPSQIGDIVVTDPAGPPPPPPSVLVPSPRPPIGPLRGPVGYGGPTMFDPNMVLTPEFFQNLLAPMQRPIGMQAGGEVLDKAAGQFLEALRAA